MHFARVLGARFAVGVAVAIAAACQTVVTPLPPAPLSTCGGRLAATELSPDWATFAVISDSADAIDVPEASDPSDAIVVRQIALDHFFVRFARQRGESMGPVQILERGCRDAPLATKSEWTGGSMVLRRRGSEYVVTRATDDAGAETPLVTFLWIANPPRKPLDAGVIDPREQR